MKNKKHIIKMIAPIVVVILGLIYLGFYAFLGLMTSEIDAWAPWFIVPMAVCIAVGLIYVLIVRIKEIKKGEDDDLSNY